LQSPNSLLLVLEAAGSTNASDCFFDMIRFGFGNSTSSLLLPSIGDFSFNGFHEFLILALFNSTTTEFYCWFLEEVCEL
jgi:hypothetical protein